MFRPIAAFELRYQLRSPVFWVGCLLFFLLTFGATTIDQIQIGSKGNVHLNAPYAILQTLGIMNVFAVFVVVTTLSVLYFQPDKAVPKDWPRVAGVILAIAFVTGAASGVFISPQQAAVADIIGNQGRGGTAVATFQMMSDLGTIIGSLVAGQIAQHVSFTAAFGVGGVVLLLASVSWWLAPETRQTGDDEETPICPLGHEPMEGSL